MGQDRGTPIIRGDKTYLRPFERDDLGLYRRWRSDALPMALAGFPERAPLSLAELEKRFETTLERQGKESYSFLICRLEDGRAIGEVILFDLDHLNGSVGFGIFIGEPELWGEGYGTDALNAAADFVFGELRIERMWLNVATENARARRAYEKAGFVHEGTLRHDRWEGGRYTDGHVMSLLRDEWRVLPRHRDSRP